MGNKSILPIVKGNPIQFKLDKIDKCTSIKEFVNALKYLLSNERPFCPSDVVSRAFSVFYPSDDGNMLTAWIIQTGILVDYGKEGYCTVIYATCYKNNGNCSLLLKYGKNETQGNIPLLINQELLHGEYFFHESDDDRDDAAPIHALLWNYHDRYCELIKWLCEVVSYQMMYIIQRELSLIPVKSMLDLWCQLSNEPCSCIWVWNNFYAAAIFYGQGSCLLLDPFSLVKGKNFIRILSTHCKIIHDLSDSIDKESHKYKGTAMREFFRNVMLLFFPSDKKLEQKRLKKISPTFDKQIAEAFSEYSKFREERKSIPQLLDNFVPWKRDKKS